MSLNDLLYGDSIAKLRNNPTAESFILGRLAELQSYDSDELSAQDRNQLKVLKKLWTDALHDLEIEIDPKVLHHLGIEINPNPKQTRRIIRRPT